MKFGPCDICLEENCKGKKNCNCKNCSVKSECPRILHPTIRITNKCTQECSHCCFASSPKSTINMTVEKAKEIAEFLEYNEIVYSNIMGGEIFCNPNWEEVLEIIIKPLKLVRIVTNGDWANSKEIMMNFLKRHTDKLQVDVSNDKWHSLKYISQVKEALEESGVKYKIASHKDMTPEAIVPVGRAESIWSGVYSMFSCYCQSPLHKYTFLIDEEGDIYKCVWGILKYHNVRDKEEFIERFKEFNIKFYDIFISSCRRCIKSVKSELCVKRN